jgi:hypothetical protein
VKFDKLIRHSSNATRQKKLLTLFLKKMPWEYVGKFTPGERGRKEKRKRERERERENEIERGIET